MSPGAPTGVTVALEAWDPGYGAAVDEGAFVASDVPTDIDVEVPVAQWAPRRPAPGTSPWPAVLFIDGVQRIDAQAWLTGDDGATRQGRCASVAAGAVRCRAGERATIVLAEVRRRLVAPAETAVDLRTAHGTWHHAPVAGDDPARLDRAIGAARADLEIDVARAACSPGEPTVVDGPLSQHRHLPGALGYVKTIQRGYGPPIVLDVAARLAPGERTPLFLVGEGVTRWSWYVRLPGPVTHPLAGVVRNEAASDLALAGAIALADAATASLPRFATRPHEDARAPQNLHPIAGLERALRHRLGDPALLLRALRAATRGVVPQA